jgi:hypothetical protein
MGWKRLVVCSLGLALCLAVAFVAVPRMSADEGVSDELAAQIKGGAAAYCGKAWDYDSSMYSCYSPCNYDGTTCPKVYEACVGLLRAVELVPYQYNCYNCTCGNFCGTCTLIQAQGCDCY